MSRKSNFQGVKWATLVTARGNKGHGVASLGSTGRKITGDREAMVSRVRGAAEEKTED